MQKITKNERSKQLEPLKDHRVETHSFELMSFKQSGKYYDKWVECIPVNVTHNDGHPSIYMYDAVDWIRENCKVTLENMTIYVDHVYGWPFLVRKKEDDKDTALRQQLLAWAKERWYDEVALRPEQNQFYDMLDITWKQVINKLGGNIGELGKEDNDAQEDA